MAGFPRTARLRSGEDFKRGLKARRRGSGRWFTASVGRQSRRQGAAGYRGWPTRPTAGHAPESNQTDHPGAFPPAGGRTRAGGCGSEAAHEALCRRHGGGRGGSRTPVAGARLMQTVVEHADTRLPAGDQPVLRGFLPLPSELLGVCPGGDHETRCRARRVAGRPTAWPLPPVASRRHRRGTLNCRSHQRLLQWIVTGFS